MVGEIFFKNKEKQLETPQQNPEHDPRDRIRPLLRRIHDGRGGRRANRKIRHSLRRVLTLRCDRMHGVIRR